MISSEILEAEEISHLPERGFQACEVTPAAMAQSGGWGSWREVGGHLPQSLVGGYDPDTPTPTPTRHDAGSRNALPALSSAPRGAERRTLAQTLPAGAGMASWEVALTDSPRVPDLRRGLGRSGREEEGVFAVWTE